MLFHLNVVPLCYPSCVLFGASSKFKASNLACTQRAPQLGRHQLHRLLRWAELESELFHLAAVAFTVTLDPTSSSSWNNKRPNTREVTMRRW